VWSSTIVWLLNNIIIIIRFVKCLRPWLQRRWRQVSCECYSKALRKKYILSLDLKTESESALLSQAMSSRQLAQNNEKLLSLSLSWWTACPVVGWQISVHSREPWCDDWGMSVLWRCCHFWQSTQPPCTPFCVECNQCSPHSNGWA